MITAVAVLLAVALAMATDPLWLADRHEKEYGMECGICHEENSPPIDLIDAAVCFECHESYAALSELTAEADPDPHNNHMVYDDTSCAECHRGHKPPALMCDGCHQFDLNIR